MEFKDLNSAKIVCVIGIILFVALLYIAPFAHLDFANGTSFSVSFVELAGGKAGVVMTDSKSTMLAGLPAVAFLIALLLPNYVNKPRPEDQIKRYRVRTNVTYVVLPLVFAVSIFVPLLQAFALIAGGGIANTDYIVTGAWGTRVIVYVGIGLLIFMALLAIPALRKKMTGEVNA